MVSKGLVLEGSMHEQGKMVPVECGGGNTSGGEGGDVEGFDAGEVIEGVGELVAVVWAEGVQRGIVKQGW